jgi:hypothetical protein
LSSDQSPFLNLLPRDDLTLRMGPQIAQVRRDLEYIQVVIAMRRYSAEGGDHASPANRHLRSTNKKASDRRHQGRPNSLMWPIITPYWWTATRFSGYP